MAQYPNTGSTLRHENGRNNTRTALSTQIVIKIGPNTIGAVQKLGVREQRTITMVDEVGTDGHIDGMPTKSTEISGSCDRIRFDKMRIAQAFSRGFLHAHSQRVAFDIEIYDSWLGDENSTIITTIKGVWIEGISYDYSSNDWIVSDNMTWKAQSISSTLSNGNAAVDNTRNMPLALDPIERAADRGERRGSMDSAGLINATLPY